MRIAIVTAMPPNCITSWRVEHDPDDENASRLQMLTRIDETTSQGGSSAVELLGRLYRGFNIRLRIAYDDLEEELRTARGNYSLQAAWA